MLAVRIDQQTLYQQPGQLHRAFVADYTLHLLRSGVRGRLHTSTRQWCSPTGAESLLILMAVAITPDALCVSLFGQLASFAYLKPQVKNDSIGGNLVSTQ